MPRSKNRKTSKNKGPVQCPRCQKYFTNIELHYEKSALCGDHALLDSSGLLEDPTLVCHAATASTRNEYTNHLSNNHFSEQLNYHVCNDLKPSKKLKAMSDNCGDELLHKIHTVAASEVSKGNGIVEKEPFPTMDPNLSAFYETSNFDEGIIFEPDSKDPAYANMSRRQLKQYFNSLVDLTLNSNDDDDSISIFSMEEPGQDVIEISRSDESVNDSGTECRDGNISTSNGNSSIAIDQFVPGYGINGTLPSSCVDISNSTHESSKQLSEVGINVPDRLLAHLEVGCYADFRHVQSDILQKHINLTMPESLVTGIKLLKMCNDSNIPNYLYEKIAKWHEDAMLCSMMSNTNIAGQQSLRFNCNIPQDRKKILKEISNLVYGKERTFQVTPVHTAIQLPSRKWTRISRFDLKGIIYSLFSDPCLMTSENCLFHNKYYRNPNMLSSIPLSQRTYTDIHTGNWFLHAYNSICSHVNDILCPIILFIDGTPIDQYGHLSLEPVLMTLGIFDRSTRNKASSWRLLGYIPEEDLHADHIPNHGNEPAASIEVEALGDQAKKRVDYHHILSYLLNDIVDLEESSGILWNIQHKIPGTDTFQTELVRFKFTVMFVIGDAPGLDKLCDRFANYNKNIRYLCRDCWCPTKELSVVDKECNWSERSHILTLDSKQCQDRSYHKIRNNAFDRMKLGNDKYGINGCVPPEILHQFLLGVIKKLTATFYKCCTVKGLKFLDSVSKYIAMNWHRNSARDIPPIQLFKDGINSKKKFTGNEEISHLFIIYLSLVQSYSLDKFVKIEQASSARSSVVKTVIVNRVVTDDKGQPALDVNGNSIVVEEKEKVKHLYPKIGSTLKNAKKWLRLFEFSLCFYYWLNSDSIPAVDVTVNGNDGKSPADRRIEDYLRLYFELVNAESGMDVNGLKIHQCKHIPHYIRRFASCLNYDGSIGERNLKSMAKNPARRTQQQSTVLAKQATERYYESTTINLVYHMLVGQGRINAVMPNPTATSCTNTTASFKVNGRYRVFFDDSGKVIETKWNNSKERRLFHNELFMKQLFARLTQPDFKLCCNYVDCFTVLTINNKDRSTTTFRADPYFFQKSWFDWCETKWEGHNDEYPSRLYMFIDPSGMDFDMADLDVDKGEYWAVTRCGGHDNRKPITNAPRRNSTLYSLESNLFDSFSLEDTIRIINCDTINSDLFVCADISGEDLSPHSRGGKQYTVEHVLKFKKVNEWGELFINAGW